mmetsp:Transcript_31089/g.46916  ORF Transcript_31089/g.46916 Transcript_31089/m.46916 type:complete len:242 (-) Transcript_31089:356-1081(-)
MNVQMLIRCCNQELPGLNNKLQMLGADAMSVDSQGTEERKPAALSAQGGKSRTHGLGKSAKTGGSSGFGLHCAPVVVISEICFFSLYFCPIQNVYTFRCSSTSSPCWGGPRVPSPGKTKILMMAATASTPTMMRIQTQTWMPPPSFFFLLASVSASSVLSVSSVLSASSVFSPPSVLSASSVFSVSPPAPSVLSSAEGLSSFASGSSTPAASTLAWKESKFVASFRPPSKPQASKAMSLIA